MPPSTESLLLLIDGNADGAVGAARQVQDELGKVAGSSQTAGAGIGKLDGLAMPSTRSLRLLGQSSFMLTGSMGELGPAAGQAGAAIRMMGMAMNGAMGPVGVLIVAIGAVVYALYKTATAKTKLDETNAKEYSSLVKLGDQLKAHSKDLRETLDYDRQIIAAKRAKTEAHIKELNETQGAKAAMSGYDMVVGVLKMDYDRVAGSNTYATYQQGMYRKELGESLIKLAEYNKELETNTDKMMKVAAAAAIAAGRKLKDELANPKKGPSGPKPHVLSFFEVWEAEQKMWKKSADLVSQELDDFHKKQEARVRALDVVYADSSNYQIMKINDEAKAYVSMGISAQAVESWRAHSVKQIRDKELQEQKRRFAQEIELIHGRVQLAYQFAGALISASGMSAKGQAEAQKGLAMIMAIYEAAEALMYLSKQQYSSAAQAGMAALQYAAVASAPVPQVSGGTMGGEGGYGGTVGGGGTATPAGPSGPVTNYIYSTMVFNGPVVGAEQLYQILDQWWNYHVRAGGGDIKRG